ncbi:type II protein arginine methyltransferase [Paragonimus westermani]|uniref:Protein arginine N-methyltransferase n=1 Tax=Paragonimus westermani TaxID=34504 RepID=A0A5J4NYB5_9TREM|nr:type II protein arginine methyltransferase [Paragonimus westermani]
MAGRALVGLDLAFTGDVVSQYASSRSSGFAFIAIDLFHPKSILCNSNVPDSSAVPVTRSDLVFKNEENLVKSLVGKISLTIDVDSGIESVRASSEVALRKELSWAVHLGLPAVSIRLLRPGNINLARLLVNFVRTEYVPIKIWLTLPMSVEENCTTIIETKRRESSSVSPKLNGGGDSNRAMDPWYWWTQLFMLASDISDSLGLVLDLPDNLPDEYVISRWLSEPVVCLLLRTDLFLTNSKGYPVLSKSHQAVIRRFFKLNVQVMITGSCRHDHGYVSYQQYLMWLWKTLGDPDLYEQQSKGLEDQLQEPLQPLRDNLSSTTYSIFEMDPYKYQAYETAIYEALRCRIEGNRSTQSPHGSNDTSPNEIANGPLETGSPTSDPQVVMVLGAGRGPLVNATLSAAERANCAVRVYVVEKNPNALFTLQDRLAHEWHDKDVHLCGGDMRNLDVSEKADIFVSELLGSFGDNELSPECLDGAQPHLKDDGISIPCSYTSFVAPFQSAQFYSETKRSHPKQSNSRSTTCSFLMEHDAVVHGLAGYFEAKLFGDVMLSTHPQRHSPQMVSWFPMAFPLDHPVYVRAGESVTVHLWRVVDSRHVWYEWALTEPRPTRIHNGAGHAYKLTL